ICFIGKLGGWGRGILPNQKVFFRVSLEGVPAEFQHVFCRTDLKQLLPNTIALHLAWFRLTLVKPAPLSARSREPKTISLA
ncbi:hypothetical protein, partial [Pseudomonas aeruginosa]|uniref:hypothetical protein n=1 Tax=Pseudomonas aeruginosa TaxID=287 RepID=UPI002097DCF2